MIIIELHHIESTYHYSIHNLLLARLCSEESMIGFPVTPWWQARLKLAEALQLKKNQLQTALKFDYVFIGHLFSGELPWFAASNCISNQCSLLFLDFWRMPRQPKKNAAFLGWSGLQFYTRHSRLCPVTFCTPGTVAAPGNLLSDVQPWKKRCWFQPRKYVCCITVENKK